jgi:hypothetical protein
MSTTTTKPNLKTDAIFVEERQSLRLVRQFIAYACGSTSKLRRLPNQRVVIRGIIFIEVFFIL